MKTHGKQAIVAIAMSLGIASAGTAGEDPFKGAGNVVMPLEKRNNTVKSWVFSYSNPWRTREAAMIAAGMPRFSNEPSVAIPGAATVTLIGSSMQ